MILPHLCSDLETSATESSSASAQQRRQAKDNTLPFVEEAKTDGDEADNKQFHRKKSHQSLEPAGPTTVQQQQQQQRLTALGNNTFFFHFNNFLFFIY